MTNEEALDELNVIYERLSHPEDCEQGVYSFRDGDYLEALDMAIKALEQTRWIPVSERLPEENEFVIVTIETATISKGKKRSVTKCMYSENSIFWKEYVVAWMPLPEPYKAESEE